MQRDNEDTTPDREIAGRSVADWETRWEHVPDGFKKLQTALGHVPGIFAAKQGNDIFYIGAATQKYPALRAGLARVRLKEQSNNSSNGMRLLREVSDDMEAFVIMMTPPIAPDEIVALKWAMIDLHRPRYNSPKDLVAAARKARYARRS